MSFETVGLKLLFGSWALDPDTGQRTVPSALQAVIKNESGKTIRAIKLKVAYFDATDDVHAVPTNLMADKTIKPGEKRKFAWRDPNESSTVKGWLLVPQKVVFEDGTSFVDATKTPHCYGEYRQGKNHTPLTKIPDSF